MNFTKINLKPAVFEDKPMEVARNGELCAAAFRYSSGVPGLKIQNSKCSFVILPYMGQQIWFAEFCGKNLTMKSIFDEPLNTVNYGDNYGALLLHCGLTQMGCPGPDEDYPLHGELPFAVYDAAYVGIGEDEKARYLAVGGTYHYRNSQEYNYEYKPELRLYCGSSVAEMHITIENKRANPLDYMFMCHINWLAVDGSRIVYSAPKDKEHITVYPTELGEDSARAKAIRTYGEKLMANPCIGDYLDSKTQVYDPELCTWIRYKADKNGWAHAMQVMPDKDACYVGFDAQKLPYALRWVCRTGDEDGIGIALPTTGNHLGTAYQKKHGLYNTIASHEQETLRFNFGYLPKEEAERTEQYIEKILENPIL